MPTDFWRNDQMLNIFRTKPCQRLASAGVCGWRSQCQFSHCLEWPRRQPRRYNYSPDLCPNVIAIEGPDGGVERVQNNCTAGLRCPYAHSKEEVLFHPHMFKTKLCEEHTNNTGNNQSQRQTRNSKKNRCHRYYCPFAHGQDELRPSPLSIEQREKCLRSMEVFPQDFCCSVCAPSTNAWPTAPVNGQKFPEAPGLTLLESPDPSTLWPCKAPHQSPGQVDGRNQSLFWNDVLATVPNQTLNMYGDPLHKQNKDFFASKIKDRPIRDPSRFVPSPIQKPTEDPVPVPYNSIVNGDLIYGAPLSELRVHKLTDDSPAFIDLASNWDCTPNPFGTPNAVPKEKSVPNPFGPRLSTKLPITSQQDPHRESAAAAQVSVGDYYFAML